MMKLLIAEDEVLCRNNLINIDWKSINIEIVGVAKDGVEAFELAKRFAPDIIISDIEMPELSGFDLAHRISDILPTSKIIFLTAYPKFEYAQAAVSLKIFEYILKPFEDEALVNSVKSAMFEIETERSKINKYTHAVQQLENTKYFLKSCFFDEISNISNKSNSTHIIFENLIPENKYTATVLALHNATAQNTFSGNYELFLNILKIISRYNAQIIPFFDISTQTFIFSHDSSMPQHKIDNNILDIMESVCEYLNFNNNSDYVIGIGKTVTGIQNTISSYNGATEALNYSFYLGLNTIICISDVESKSISYDYESIYDNGLLNHIKVGDTELSLSILKKLFNAFKNNCEEISVVQRVCNELFSRISLCVIQCGINPSTLFEKTDGWSVIRKYQTINELETFMTNIIEVTISHICFSRTSRTNSLVESIKKYIHESPQTTLTDIAKHFYHSPNYLSNIFSQETGMTMKNYIMQTRIEVSKKLLAEPNSSIYEIANAVGYKTAPHFSMVFKKMVGISPSEFQSNSRNNPTQ